MHAPPAVDDDVAIPGRICRAHRQLALEAGIPPAVAQRALEEPAWLLRCEQFVAQVAWQYALDHLRELQEVRRSA